MVQILTALLSLGLIFFYIQPTLTGVRPILVEIEKHQKSLASVDSVLLLMNQQIANLNSIPEATKSAFNTYLPVTIDEVLVLRDVYTILFLNQITPDALRYSRAASSDATKLFVTHNFELNFITSYDKLKQFLQRIERLRYPLEVHTMTLNQDDGGLVTVSLKLVTYSRK